MASQANVTVYDGAPTPVSHTLVPSANYREGGKTVVEWREQLASLPDEAQVSFREEKKVLPSGVTQKELIVNVPVMESVSGQNAAGYTAAPKVAFVDQIKITQFSHPRSTGASRRLARMIAVNLANNVSTSVAAATSGPAAEMFDNGIMPS